VSHAIIETQENPLITFVVFAYNQEQYIREAIEGAFSQTYSPLQIILSDDCSTDCTFEIMQEMVEHYVGSHKIVLNRNEKNLHIGGHINKVMELAKGVLIVGAAGDDISVPERTAVIAECYLSNNRIACSIYSDANYIDVNGKFTGLYSVARPEGYFRPVSYARGKFHGVLGASHAWHKCLFDKFGPLPPNITYEDDIIPFRAALLGKVIHIPQPLVRYRRHDGSVMNQTTNASEKQLLNLNRFLMVYDSNLKDLMHYCFFINYGFPSKEACIKEIFRQRTITVCTINTISGTLITRFVSILIINWLRFLRHVCKK
jgi:glycosyltransferase involved in cell wall biosynthesis